MIKCLKCLKANSDSIANVYAEDDGHNAHLMISRPSGDTRYWTIHLHASLLLDNKTSTVAIHSSVSTLREKTAEFYIDHIQWSV